MVSCLSNLIKEKMLILKSENWIDLKSHGIVLSNCYELKLIHWYVLDITTDFFFRLESKKPWWRWDSEFLKDPFICDLCKCVCQISSFFYTSVWYGMVLS
jgi:hypothetical protein